MRERSRDEGRLLDIIEHSGNVTMLIEGYTLEAFISDKRTYYSVMKNIEIVGEAAFMLTKSFKQLHPEIPWKVVQGMRHVLVHDYANIDIKELYNTAVNDMIPLRLHVQKFLDETDWKEWESVSDELDDAFDSSRSILIESARRMKAKGISNSDISDVTGLSADELNEL